MNHVYINIYVMLFFNFYSFIFSSVLSAEINQLPKVTAKPDYYYFSYHDCKSIKEYQKCTNQQTKQISTRITKHIF